MRPKKVYTTTPTKGKDGVTRPVTRVHLEKPCPVCAQPMRIEKHKKGGMMKRAWTRWRCTDKSCNHSEIDEGEKDSVIRRGGYDREAGILKPYIEAHHGDSVHREED
jgi:hypothetical protein